ncbi:MAG: hypothetical protein Kow0099_34580 [Candidatus Abyssubacteria bacterium]
MRRSVCLVTNAYPDFPDSTRVVFIRLLAELLAKEGWGVSVVAPRIFKGSLPYEKEGPIEIRRFPSFLGNKLLVQYPRTPVFRLAGYMAAGIISAVRCIRVHRCDLLHAHWVVPAGLIGIIAGRLWRKPVIVTAHGSDILVTPKGSRTMRGIVRFVLQKADGVTSVADHLTEEIVQMGIQRERVLTFPMSVPTDSFRPEGPSVQVDEGPIIFSNRSLYPIYNVELLIRAAPLILNEVPRAKILVAGEGPEAERLASLIHSLALDDQVRLVGALPHSRMPEYLRGATVYVSTALSDGASVSLLEAMACGIFPVVADIPANREWITDGKNGLLFDARDATSLASRVVHVLNHPELREYARSINPGIVGRKAQWNSNLPRLLALYESYVGNSPGT